MAERHTVDFDRDSFNILTDHGRRLITIQFERAPCHCDANSKRRPPRASEARRAVHGFGCPCRRRLEFVGRILKPVRRRFGPGPARRLVRWLLRAAPPPLIPARRLRPHPDDPDIACWDLAIREGCRPEVALAALLERLRGLPGYRRTFGPPLDPNEDFDETSGEATAEPSAAARSILQRLIERRRRGRRG